MFNVVATLDVQNIIIVGRVRLHLALPVAATNTLHLPKRPGLEF